MESPEARGAPALTLVARYERTIAASPARIWENVLDWEHLPWLHRTSFRSVRLIEESPRGWLAWIALPGGRRSPELVARVELDRPRLRYLTSTVEGEGAGTEIWTSLEPAAERATRIAVEFHLPGVEPERTEAIGGMYRALYHQLWNEDEEMMMRRQQLLDEGGGRLPRFVPDSRLAPVSLGNATTLRERLPLLVTAYGRKLRVIELGGELMAHDTMCPHLGGPLEETRVEDGCITCPWHGYRYDLRRGGASAGAHSFDLASSPRVTVDAEAAEAWLAWP